MEKIREIHKNNIYQYKTLLNSLCHSGSFLQLSVNYERELLRYFKLLPLGTLRLSACTSMIFHIQEASG